MKQDSYNESLKYYLIITFILTFGTGIFIYILGGSDGLNEYPVLSNLIMFFPAIVAIIVTGVVEKNIKLSSLLKVLGLRLGKIKYLIIYPIKSRQNHWRVPYPPYNTTDNKSNL